MNEHFNIVDICKGENKKGVYYYLICYSNLRYLIIVYLDKKVYDELSKLSKIDLFAFPVDKYLNKRYYNNKFYYSLVDIYKNK